MDHEELIAVDTEAAVSAATTSGKSKKLAANDLSDVFGIELDTGNQTDPITPTPATRRKTKTTRKPATKKAAKKRSPKRKTSSPKKSLRAAKSPTKRNSAKKKKK